MDGISTKNPWAGDLLGYQELGVTFTNLIKSIDDTKVISIEAGFGHGKTFFRKAWAEHLRQQGEVVIEIDAQQSDHSGEPVITFLGALLDSVPRDKKTKTQQVVAGGKKWAGVVGRVVAHSVLRNGAEELIGAIADAAAGEVDGIKTLEDTIAELEQGMSKVAGQLIATQLAAEHARTKELPEQLEALRQQLTENATNKRVVIIIDELDRCSPEYAISLLEAMKLVFGLPGYVFCLMVNADYLERIAQHRFGGNGGGERYLDKFVDIRIALKASWEVIQAATTHLAQSLPLKTPLGEDPAFSVGAAAELAGALAVDGGLSFRQVKRVLGKVDLALRCYRGKPLDCSLLVLLAFVEAKSSSLNDRTQNYLQFLPRAALSPSKSATLLENLANDRLTGRSKIECQKFVEENCKVMLGLDEGRYDISAPKLGRSWEGWRKVLAGLGPHYIPDHQDVLNAVHKFQVAEPSGTA